MSKAFDTYKPAREHAQANANRYQLAYGVERTIELGRVVFVVRMLPSPENRCGAELRCEIVQPIGAPPEAPQPCGWIDPGPAKGRARKGRATR